MDSATLATKLAEYNAKPVTSVDALNEAMGKYGVPEIRNTVSGLRTTVSNTTNALNAVDPSVTGRTQGSLVTEAQRQKQVANERAPIAEQLGTQSRTLTDQQQALADALGLATGEANNKVGDWERGRSALQGQYDVTYKREQDVADRAAQAQAETEKKRQFDLGYQLDSRKAASGSGGAQVNPGEDFLSYISAQFKSSGGAGNKKITRQTQDSWANAWFAQNGVSKENRQQYWNLFNKTYNRSDDPTKDWRYAK